jgi:hypothetical protein
MSWYGSRYNGVRLTPHLACSFDCPGTLDNARKWMDLGTQLKLNGLTELHDILNMPTSWDVMHGIAMVTTPVFRLVTNSVPCTEQFVIRKEGNFVPKEAAKGLTFPFLR